MEKRTENEMLRSGVIVAAIPALGKMGFCRLCRAQWRIEERHIGDCPAREERRDGYQ